MVQIDQKYKDQSLGESTVVLSLTLSGLSNTKKIGSDSGLVQTEVDRTMLHISKDLFDAPELEAVCAFQRNLKAKIRKRSLPSFMRGGLFLVKMEAIETLDAILNGSAEEFKGLVKAFADVVDERKEQSRERLGPAFVSDEFPDEERILKAFGITWHWFALSTPASLSKISKSFFEREAKKAEAAFKGAVEYSEGLLLTEAKGLVDHMIDRLTADPVSGKPKKFKNSIVENIKEFLDSCPFRSLSNNEEVEAQFAKMRKLVEGVDPESLRKVDRLRQDVRDGFSEVKDALSKVIVEGQERFMDAGAYGEVDVTVTDLPDGKIE